QRLGEATSLVFVVIVAISAYEVVMRYAFDAPTIWVHEISVALAAAAFAIGGPYVHGTRQHIAIMFFFDRLPQAARRWVRVLLSLLTLAFLSLLTYAAGSQALQSLREGETSGTALNLPIPATLKTVFALCCVVLLAQTVGQLVADVRAARSRS
ncbi:MAG TPA: TRAP transporter small permease, partial [Burkholderiales bacterium]|nr:TRAP transporter small permease [Burkholderiales bacterium]